jgi:hypothetical protein
VKTSRGLGNCVTLGEILNLHIQSPYAKIEGSRVSNNSNKLLRFRYNEAETLKNILQTVFPRVTVGL